MKLQIFSVHDAKVSAFLPVFQARTPAEAQRSFADAVNSPDHQFGKYPEDYTLFRLASFNDESGMIEPDKSSICNGLEVKQHGTHEGKRQEPPLAQIQ